MHQDRYAAAGDKKKGSVLSVAFKWVPFTFFLMLSPFIIIYAMTIIYVWIEKPYDIYYREIPAWDYFKKSGLLTTIAVIAGLVLPFYLGGNIRGHFNTIAVDGVRKEKEDEIRGKYGAEGFASDSDIDNLLNK